MFLLNNHGLQQTGTVAAAALAAAGSATTTMTTMDQQHSVTVLKNSARRNCSSSRSGSRGGGDCDDSTSETTSNSSDGGAVGTTPRATDENILASSRNGRKREAPEGGTRSGDDRGSGAGAGGGVRGRRRVETMSSIAREDVGTRRERGGEGREEMSAMKEEERGARNASLPPKRMRLVGPSGVVSQVRIMGGGGQGFCSSYSHTRSTYFYTSNLS